MKPNVIVIIAAARSGTKMLRHILDASQEISSYPYDANYIWKYGNFQLNHDEILAHILEFIPSQNTLQNILYRERAEFYDQTGLAGGGNKTRKLEFLMADAQAKGVDVVLTCGGAQSNHARATAAAARATRAAGATDIRKIPLLGLADSVPGAARGPAAPQYFSQQHTQPQVGRKRRKTGIVIAAPKLATQLGKLL